MKDNEIWGSVKMLGRYGKVMIYVTLGLASVMSLIAALAIPDKLDVFESQIAAIYFTLLVGTVRAFNAKPVCGWRVVGAITTFTSTGLFPATIIHVAIAQIEPSQNDHSGTLAGYAIVAGLSFVCVVLLSPVLFPAWRFWEAKCSGSDSGNCC